MTVERSDNVLKARLEMEEKSDLYRENGFISCLSGQNRLPSYLLSGECGTLGKELNW